ncbi:response regulator transcription factor [Gordonia sp. L191]|uniref:response regulator transcription factor n=1 Tax=Gordonia sp. L191 TaxID=2982699 RepID=UPI0024BF7525|nr:response regulator transcription factor [Gordonia sp. L191]WHU47712.1 response regulator transcription factor [Gordonia sp. L191]
MSSLQSSSEPASIRVVVIDDEALIRSGFEFILNADAGIDVVGTATGADAVAVVSRTRPDVVLLDIRMPDIDGLQVLPQLRRLDHAPTVAMLTTFDADDYILTALHAGAAGFILKDTDPDHLADAVRTLASGGVVLSAAANAALLRATDHGTSQTEDPQIARVDMLTARERDVVRLVARGMTNAEVGQQLHLSVGTVKDHISATLTKLRVGSRVEIALLAQRAGLLDESPDR